jgi:hypothetical protein
MNYEQKDGMIYDPEDGQTIATMSESATPEQAALLAAAPQQAACIAELENQLEDMKDTLYQCLPFFEDWKDEDGIYKPKTMAFMIRMIRRTIGEPLE